MKIHSKKMMVCDFSFLGEPLGLFHREGAWNGMAKYVCLRGRFESEYLIMIDASDVTPALFFFSTWDKLLDEADKDELVPIHGSRDIVAHLNTLASKAQSEGYEDRNANNDN